MEATCSQKKQKTKGDLLSSSGSYPFHSPKGLPLFKQLTLLKLYKLKVTETQTLIQAKLKLVSNPKGPPLFKQLTLLKLYKLKVIETQTLIQAKLKLVSNPKNYVGFVAAWSCR
jgi:hypothetical protein